MKKVSYTLVNGSKREVEYDERAPCRVCGLPVVEASMGGVNLCPWCDCGVYRDGGRWTLSESLNVELIREKALEMECIIGKIKRRFNVEIIDVRERLKYYNEVGMEEEDFVGKSYIIGKDTVVLGIYKNDEQRIASLFHEVGHILVAGDYEDQFEYEAEAWKKGIELAIEYGISFSGETMMWISRQMGTYKHGDV